MNDLKKEGKTLLLIVLGSLIYALATQLCIFSNSLFLGGTSGVSVILNHFLPGISSGEFLMGINITLMLLAVVLLGKGMAVKTFLGSTFTTVFIGMLDKAFSGTVPLISNPILSGVIGASVVAVGSALLFSVDSSSGGTDIIALIIRKYSDIHIGRALLVADVAIVIMGACISPLAVAAASAIGLLIKTFGIDFLILSVQKLQKA